MGFRGQIRRNREFRDVEFQVPHHPLESVVRHLDVGEIEIEARRPNFALLQGRRVGVVPQERSQRQDVRIIAHMPYSSSFVRKSRIQGLRRAA